MAVRTVYDSTRFGNTADSATITSDPSGLADQLAYLISGTGHLFVVLHGKLNNFSLQDVRVKGRELIQWQPIRFLPHAGSLDSQRWLPSFTVRAVEVLGDSLNDLPGARSEAAHVATLLGTVAKFGGQVAMEAVAMALSTADLIHIAGMRILINRIPLVQVF